MKYICKIIGYLLFLSIVIYSCQTKQDLLPNSGGEPGEIIIVVEKNVWNSSVGEELKKILMTDYPALPQDEPSFLLYPVPLENFNDIFQANRNIIKITFNPNSDTMFYRIGKDRWAKPQLIIEFVAKDIKNMTELIHQKGSEIKELLLSEERNRLMKVYEKFREKSLIQPLKKFNISLIIPKGYRLNIDTTNFIWISAETPYMSQGLFIYTIPYTDTSQFQAQYLIGVRDSVLKKYIPGPLEGTYMTTEHLYPYEVRRFPLHNRFTCEIRGLWKIENDFMGGPFVMLATVVNNQIIITEGYVYAPKDDKKNYVWQIESILYSINILK
ncbi:MAG: DUF4837 family protein [Bacteroidales bacterium]|nr:DUF4837 family protein [Bacteroidales bacterium]